MTLATHTRQLLALNSQLGRYASQYQCLCDRYENKWDKQSHISPKWSDGLVSCFQSEWFSRLFRNKLCNFADPQHLSSRRKSFKVMAVLEEKEVFKYIKGNFSVRFPSNYKSLKIWRLVLYKLKWIYRFSFLSLISHYRITNEFSEKVKGSICNMLNQLALLVPKETAQSFSLGSQRM